MNTLIRIELLKLRTTRLPYGLLAAVAELVTLVAVLASIRAGSAGDASLATAGGLSNVLTATGLAMLLSIVLGVIASSGEFRHKTATVTYLACPSRERVLIAKATAAGAFGLLFGAVGTAITAGVGLAFVAGHGYPLALSGATIARIAAGTMLGSGLLAAAGVGIGSLIRSQLGAVIAVFAWCLVLESILGGVFSSAARYFPFTAATTLAGANAGGGSFGYAGTAGSAALPFTVAAIVVAGVTVIISAVALRTTVQADIS